MRNQPFRVATPISCTRVTRVQSANLARHAQDLARVTYTRETGHFGIRKGFGHKPRIRANSRLFPHVRVMRVSALF